MPVAFLQSESQNVFYVQNLSRVSTREATHVLNKYRSKVSVGSAIALVDVTSNVVYWVNPASKAQVLNNATLINFYMPLIDEEYLDKEFQETNMDAEKPADNKIIGSSRAKVDELLDSWASEPSEVSVSNVNYYDSEDTVKLTVSFESNDVAVAVSVVNLYGIPISEAKVNQLLSVIGGPTPEIVRYGGEIVEFYVGDVHLY